MGPFEPAQSAVSGGTEIKNRERVALYTECHDEKLLPKSIAMPPNATGGAIKGTARNTD